MRVTLDRIVDTFALLAIALACAIVLHKSASFIGAAPRLSDADTAANVAVGLVEHGRAEVLASPATRSTDDQIALIGYRRVAFWPAAAATWLLGPSLVLYRLLHPLGLVGIVIVLTMMCRSISLAGPCIVAVGLFTLYFDSHRPVARPEIVASVAVALALAALAAALTRRRIVDWLAATIAIVFAMASLPTWSRAATRPFSVALSDQFANAWGSLSAPAVMILAVGFAGAVVVLIAATRQSPERRRAARALIGPPCIVAIAYALALGFTGTTRSGDAILLQVAVLWTIGATISVAVRWIADAPAPGRVLSLAMTLVAALFVARADAAWLRGASPLERQAVGSVNIEDYVHQVLSRFPERARVWGSGRFGLTTGDRTDLVDLRSTLALVHDFQPAARASLAPDFLAIGGDIFADAAGDSIATTSTVLADLARTFAPLRYRPIRIVSAPPYGSAIDFEKVAGSDSSPDPAPEVAFNDGAGRQWTSGLSAPLNIAFTAVEPTRLELADRSGASTVPVAVPPAAGALAADVPEGAYLIGVDLSREGASGGFILATGTRVLRWRADRTMAAPVTPYFPHARRAWILADHLGGPLFISQFANDPNERSEGLNVTSVRRVDVAPDLSGRRPALALPPWTAWTRAQPTLTVTPSDGGTATLRGQARPHQPLLVSPPIAVPAHQRIVLTLPFDARAGAIAVAVTIDGAARASTGVIPQRLTFDTGRATEVVLTIVNADSESVDVHVQPAALRAVLPSVQYVDQVMHCRSPYIALDRSDCIQ